jgi:hypothetical protein
MQQRLHKLARKHMRLDSERRELVQIQQQKQEMARMRAERLQLLAATSDKEKAQRERAENMAAQRTWPCGSAPSTRCASTTSAN